MKQSVIDINFMKRALQLAKIAGLNTAPNPMVGAVIVFNNRIIGEGYHRYYGKAHAEVNAVKSVKDKSLLHKSTIYVTLEPCSHTGKTPPCTDLIIHHQFKRVVIACEDSYHKVAGKGIIRLKNAGISVESGILKEEAQELNKRFFTYHKKKTTFYYFKMGADERRVYRSN